MQDKAKPRPFHVVDRVLRLELGAGAEEVFAEFSAEATAAASLAQVRGPACGWVAGLLLCDEGMSEANCPQATQPVPPPTHVAPPGAQGAPG